jgi:hypothetical protein
VGAFAAPAILRARNLNDRLNLAFIGVGGRGGGNLQEIAGSGNENVVALCDVNSQNLGLAANLSPKPARSPTSAGCMTKS